MNLLNRHLMHRRFDLSEPPEDADAALFDLGVQTARTNDVFDLAQRAMAVVMSDLDRKVRPGYPRTQALLKPQIDPIQAQLAHLRANLRLVDAGVDQRSEQHVSRDARKAVQVADSHY